MFHYSRLLKPSKWPLHKTTVSIYTSHLHGKEYRYDSAAHILDIGASLFAATEKQGIDFWN